MENTETCKYCGAGMKAFWHSLTPGLVSVLIKAIIYVKKTKKNKFHYKDLNLNYSEASNLQKLRFHGLIAHYDKDKKRNGEWLITTRGGEFLRGEISIPKQVKIFRNKIQEHSEERIHIDQLKHRFSDFDSKFAYEYDQNINLIKPLQLSIFQK